MDELQRLTSGTCTELERLAAAAATMGYSDSMALPAAHHITPSGPMPPASTLTPSLVTQYSDPYDLSRAHQYTVTRIDPQVRSVYEQPRGTQPPPTAHHQPPPTTLTTAVVTPSPAHTHGSTRTAVQFDRNGHYLRSNNQFPTPVSSSAPIPFGTENRGIALSVSTPVVPSVGAVGPGGVHTTTASVVGHGLVQYPPVLPDNSTAVVQHPVIQQTAVAPHTHNATTATTTTSDTQQHSSDDSEEKKNKKPKVEPAKVRKKKSYVLSEVDDNEGCVLDLGVEDVMILPQPMESNGKMYYHCDQCEEKFEKPNQWRRHHQEHAMKKRNGLALEIKIEIIKRINAGEKQSDMAEEYGLNRSTIKSIIKKSDNYMSCWKKGMFHPDTKRLKGPKREDIEQALYSWYQQAVAMGVPVSGPILCNKALDFAQKLGHTDFKATHGWLDRFKKRKTIVFGRSNTKKKKEEEDVQMLEDMKHQDWQGQILHQVFMDYEANDIFHADEHGLLFRMLPMSAMSYKGEKCSGGRHSKQRVTVLMCANMTGSEKFPLLVIGRFAKPASFKNVKSLPVQYLSNKKAWMTSESFTAWLHDLDSWFVQQNRKVCVVIPNLPVHPKTSNYLRAVRIVTSPTGFTGPMKHGIVTAMKRNYRRAMLEHLISCLERDKGKRNKKGTMRFSLLSCLHMLAAAWHAVTDVTINNSFQRAGIVKYGLWGMNLQAENSLGAENVALLHKLRALGLKIPDMTFDDFVHFDDEVQVCNLMNDDDILASVTGVGDEDDEESDEDIDNDEDGEDNHGPSASEVEASLAVLRCHIQYQEDAQEMFRVLAHLEYLIYKGQGGKGVSVQSSTTVQ